MEGLGDAAVDAGVAGLRVGVLGPFEVRIGERPVDLGSPKQRAVLGVLAALAPAAVPTQRLVDELWGDAGPANPLRSLQVYVSGLRAALGEHGGRVVTEGRAYRLDLTGASLDAERFTALIEDASTAADPAVAVALADEADGLWRGEAWQDLRELAVVEPLAAALEERRVAAAAIRARAMLALGRHRELAPWLEPLVRSHPLHEELRGHLMLALHRSDRQADALAVYAEGRELKVDQVGLDPGTDLQRLQAAILADDPSLHVEDVELRFRRHLPAQMTRLIGRELEITALVDRFHDPDTRLVTVVGPGGIGKTRVGLAAAHRLAAEHPDGVWFVPLDAVHDPRLVVRAIAGTLGVEEVAGDVVAPLRAHLAERRVLLVLDNFEQVEDAAPAVTDLLAAAPGLRALVTSRVRLRVYGERVVELDPLVMGDAVSLFLDRARAVDDRFGAGPEQVAEICEQLDRMPLAIELVAARVDEVPLTAMRAQLDAHRALDLATHGPRDRSARQQTLRDAIGWSVALLPPDLAGRFARLGVFDGGFDAEAARAVAGLGGDDLGALVRSSLVVPDGGGRHRLLETVRAYAAEVLGGESEHVADQHAAWFLDVAAGWEEGRFETSADWMGVLDQDRANLRVALARLAGTADRDDPPGTRVLRMAAEMGRYWYHAGPSSEDTEWLPRALAVAPDAAAELRARAEYAMGICRAEAGRVADALEHCRTAYELLRHTDARVWTARALNSLAGLHHDVGRSEEAAHLMDESIALRRELGGELRLAIPLHNRAVVAVFLGDARTARACLQEVLDTEGDDPVEAANAQLGLADVELLVGDLDAAADRLRASIDVLLSASYQEYRLMESLETFAALAVARDEPALAATLLAAADRAYADEGAVMVPGDLALRERRTGDTIAALDPEVRRSAEQYGAGLTLRTAVELACKRLL
ncbi:MAG TPA: BTAD domain-containing putative transcriptional regulator [Nocardioides sp.]|nr:BTAD domain-containing putative transcriptional regulator [Nocardioides sp.]